MERRVSFEQFLEDNWLGVVAVISAVFLLILIKSTSFCAGSRFRMTCVFL